MSHEAPGLNPRILPETKPEIYSVPMSVGEIESQNVELLRGAEMGVILETAYLEAVKLDPRLADVEIVPLDDESSSIARARPAWVSENGRHQVHLSVDNLDDKLLKIDDSLDGIPGARQHFADKMGISSDEITPQLMHVFALLHELGHVSEYMDYENNPEELNTRVKREKLALPIGRATVSAIMSEGTRANTFVQKNWDAIHDSLGVATMEELLQKQHDAYRDMTSETFADDFAASVLAMNPVLLDQMTGGNLENYRNFAVAA